MWVGGGGGQCVHLLVDREQRKRPEIVIDTTYHIAGVAFDLAFQLIPAKPTYLQTFRRTGVN